jgi:spore coat protein A, manganese oxidase
MARLKYKIGNGASTLFDPSDDPDPTALAVTQEQSHLPQATLPPRAITNAQALEHVQALELAADRAQPHLPPAIPPVFTAEAQAARTDASLQLAPQLTAALTTEVFADAVDPSIGGGATGFVLGDAAAKSEAELSLRQSPEEEATPKLLDPTWTFQTRFTNELPLPERIDANQPWATYTLQMGETEQRLGLVDKKGEHLITTVWGYGQPGETPTYPGPTILAYENTPIYFKWENNLPLNGHLLPVDTTIHLAVAPVGEVPTVTHLHEGHSPSGSDGLPEAWFTQTGLTGPDFQNAIYTYPNDQEAATLWYHDHALGFTRLNVYAGLAGFYLLQDDNSQNLITVDPVTKQSLLPGGSYSMEMAIQDRAFTADGQLYYPAYKNDPLPGTQHDTVKDVVPKEFYKENGNDAPSVVPEFFGDHILVNGMAWPKLDVDPAEYRFQLLDGSDSRFYVLQVDNPEVKVTLVGTDAGLLEKAITVIDGVDAFGDGRPDAGEQIVLAPGDRLDLVFNFQSVPGESVTLTNIGPAYEPFKGLTADGHLAGGATAATADDPVGQIIRFNVADTEPIDNATFDNGTILNNFVVLSEANAANVRALGIFEGTDEFGRIMGQLGVAENTTDINGNPVEFGPLAWDDPITETPQLGTTEVWELYNFTEDAHPIHLHLVHYQVLERQQIAFTDEEDNKGSSDEPDGIPDDVNHDGQITIGPGGSDNDIFLLG